MAAADDQVFDVLVIGGGVVGCSVLAELTKHGYRCLLVEKEPELLSGASSGNRYVIITSYGVYWHLFIICRFLLRFCTFIMEVVTVRSISSLFTCMYNISII
jgi:glycine/D-amino acid oxidase-like deaminating enzyme